MGIIVTRHRVNDWIDLDQNVPVRVAFHFVDSLETIR